MAWSYRQDRSDEVYADNPGVTLVSGEKLPHTPASPQHAKEMLDKAKEESENAKKKPAHK